MPSEGEGLGKGALDFRAASRAILQHLQDVQPMSVWFVSRVIGDDHIVLSAVGDVAPGEGQRYDWHGSISWLMASGRGPRVAPRVEDVPEYATARYARARQVGSYIGAPLLDLDGSVFGTLCAVDPEPRTADLVDALPAVDLHARLLSSILAGELEIEAERRRAERAELASMIDPLTGVANRRGWEALLTAEEDRCRRYGDHAAVMILDLDGLKAVNDTYGHPAGDEMIRLTSQVLESCLREADAVARLGGDEFGVLVVGCNGRDTDRLASRLEAALLDCGVSASTGLARRGAAHETLIAAWEAADREMLGEKRRRHLRRGLARWSTAAPRWPSEASPAAPELAVVSPESLLAALDDHQLRLHLQPVVSIGDSQIRGAEALLRWQHPTRGLLSPREFLAVAETAGVIRPIGDWVIAEACRLARRCVDDGHDVAFSISANVSVHQLDDPDFARRVVDRLAEAELEARRLHIEVTETLPLGDSSAMRRNLAALRAHGVQVALDDFGTRYATLETLMRAELDVVKIDRVFVRDLATDPTARALVGAVVDLCSRIGMDVVAEGIETAEQADVLRDLGCPHGQGYFFGAPAPAEQFLVPDAVLPGAAPSGAAQRAVGPTIDVGVTGVVGRLATLS
jgi:diguanylate cyclase (GGDEF)-like protein